MDPTEISLRAIKRTAQTYKASNCQALEEHSRNKCQSRRSTCLKCGQQVHWVTASTPAVATVASDDDKQVASASSGVKTTDKVTIFFNRIYKMYFN